MANRTPLAQLYLPFWLGAWGSILIVSLGGWFAQPILRLESSGFLIIQLGIFWIGSRYIRSYPELTSVAVFTLGFAITILFLALTHQTWKIYGLEGVIYGVLSAPFALGIALVWGWAGMTINLAAFMVIAFLPSARLEASSLGLMVLGLHSLLGWTLRRFFQGYEARQNELERSISTDTLTQIGNRRALLEDFAKYQLLAQQQGLPLLLTSWDVDGLKRINDSKGHLAGDEYILEFVHALQGAVREKDGLYRTGGDEFVALHLGLASGGRLYERVRLDFPHVSGGWSRATNVSLDNALTEADVQMYAEKRRHKAVITRIIGESQIR